MLDWINTLDPSTRTGLWILVVGGMTNMACALVGCFLVLRRMSLMGDAIAHAVLPGLVIAFLLSGTLAIGPLMLGAIAVGLLTAFLTQTLHRFGNVPSDASMGVVFTSLFALGIVLVKRYIEGVHFDVDCVWEGSLLMLVFDTTSIGGVEVPRHAFTIGPVLLIDALVVTALWKELKISSFDPPLSTTLGFPATWLHYLLMAMVAITAVAAFEAVGSILVVAMLIVPGATAHLVTDRLSRMVGLALVVALAATLGGYGMARALDVEVAGAVTVAAGFFYVVAVLGSPRYGLFSRVLHNMSTSLRIIREDVLAMLYRLEELGVAQRMTSREAITAVGGGVLARVAVRDLVRRRRVTHHRGGLELTESGRSRARNLLRSHRLWEAYLVEYLGLPLDHVHEPAERMEHFIDEQMQQRLAEELTDAATDPHGREIP
jgi:ABC-type Mn2+/Zn2+ transport system permease subunit/Mn-dependent DtxR family transcriptional regulator